MADKNESELFTLRKRTNSQEDLDKESGESQKEEGDKEPLNLEDNYSTGNTSKNFKLANRFINKKIRNKVKMTFSDKQAIYDQYSVYNRKFIPFEEFEGPPLKRRCTNMFIYFLFILFFIALGGTILYSYQLGDVDNINYLDFRGRRCGRVELSHRPYVYYMNPSLDMNLRMCVESCPDSTGLKICLYKKDGVTPTTFCYTQMNTERYGSLCIPSEASTKKKFFERYFDIRRYLLIMVADLYYSWDYILISFVFMVGICFLTMELFRHKKTIIFIIWFFLLNIIISFIILAFFFRIEYNNQIKLRCLFELDKYNCGGLFASIFYYGYFACFVCALLYFFVIMFLFNKIVLIISLIRTSLKITERLNESRYLPLIGCLMIILYAMGFIFTQIHIFTIGDLILNDTKDIDGGKTKDFQQDLSYSYYLPIVIIALLYLFNFFTKFIEYLIGFMITIWFFYRKKQTIYLPISRVMGHVFGSHIGTIAIYTFISLFFSPFIFFCNLIGEWLKTRKSKFFITLQVIFLPIIFIHFKFTRYISNNFYIQNYLWNNSFWTSCKKSYFLMDERNKHRKEGPNALFHFVLFQIKMSIGFMGGMLYLLLVYITNQTIYGFSTDDIQIKYEVFIFIIFISFYITSVFLDSFEIVNQTTLQCYFIDEEMFVGGQRYAGDWVNDLVEFYANKDIAAVRVKAEKGQRMGIEKFDADRINFFESNSSDSKSESNSDDSDSYEEPKNFTFKQRKVSNEERDFIEELESQISDNHITEEDEEDEYIREESEESDDGVMMFMEDNKIERYRDRQNGENLIGNDRSNNLLVENARNVLNDRPHSGFEEQVNNLSRTGLEYEINNRPPSRTINNTFASNTKLTSHSNVNIEDLSKEESLKRLSREKSETFNLNFKNIKEESDEDY